MSTEDFMELGDEVVLPDEEGKRRLHVCVECAGCKTIFPRAKRFARRRAIHYCSKACYAIGRTKSTSHICPICSKPFVAKSTRKKAKSGLLFCSRPCKDAAQSHKFRLLKCGLTIHGNAVDYRAMAFAAHGKACKWCGDTLEPILDAHHIDHNRQNNDPTNLMVLCCGCHALETRGYVTVGSDGSPIVLESDYKSQILFRVAMPMGASRICNAAVAGSIPVPST